MPRRQLIDYSRLEVGYELPASSYHLDHAAVATYLGAVGDGTNLYSGNDLVPPMAVAAYAIAALSENVLPGTIHVSQELEFQGVVTVNDTLTCYAKVSRKQSRGKLRLLFIDLNVFNQRNKTVLTGKTSFILPEQDGEGSLE